MYIKKNIKVLMAILCSFMVSTSICAMEENSKEVETNQTGEKFNAVRKNFKMDEIEYELEEMKKENWDDMSKTKDVNNLNNSAIFTAQKLKKDFNKERVDVNRRRLNRFVDNVELNQNYEQTNIKNIINEKDYDSRYDGTINRLDENLRYLNDLKLNGVDEKTENKIDGILGKIANTRNLIIGKEINARAKKDLEFIEKNIKKLEKYYEKNNGDEEYVCRDGDFLIILKSNREYLEWLKKEGKADQQTKEKIDVILERIKDTEMLLYLIEKLIWIKENIEILEKDEKSEKDSFYKYKYYNYGFKEILKELKANKKYLEKLSKEKDDKETIKKIEKISGIIKEANDLLYVVENIKSIRLKLLENLRWIKRNVESLEKKEEKSEEDSLYKNYFYGFKEISNELKANREYLEELLKKELIKKELDELTIIEIVIILTKIEETENFVKNKQNYIKIKENLKSIKKDIKKLENKEEKKFDFKDPKYGVKTLFYEEEDIERMEKNKFEKLKKNVERLFDNKKTLKQILDKEQVNNNIKNNSIPISNKNFNLMLKTLEEIMPKMKLEYYEDDNLHIMYKTIEDIGKYQKALSDLRDIEKDEKTKTRITNLIHNFYFMILDFIKMFTYKISAESFENYKAFDMIFYLGELTEKKNFLSKFNKVKDRLLKDKNFKTIFKKIIEQNDEELNEIIEKIKEQMVRVFNIYANLINGENLVEDMDKFNVEYHVTYLKYVKNGLYVLLNEEEKLVFDSIMEKFNDRLNELAN